MPEGVEVRIITFGLRKHFQNYNVKDILIHSGRYKKHNNLSGFDQMALDLNSLDQTISNPEIVLTLRFYYWTGDWLSIGFHQKEIPLHWKKYILIHF